MLLSLKSLEINDFKILNIYIQILINININSYLIIDSNFNFCIIKTDNNLILYLRGYSLERKKPSECRFTVKKTMSRRQQTLFQARREGSYNQSHPTKF